MALRADDMALDLFLNTFAGNPLDRASERRGDADWLKRQLASKEGRGLAYWNGKLLTERRDEGLAIAWLPGRLIAELSGGAERLLFLGLDGEAPVFAADLEGAADPGDAALANLGRFIELRNVALDLSPQEAAIAACARGMFEWRRRHRHCAVCGQPSHPADGGWKRVCEACSAEHFPRTDPVVIMLPHHGGRCALGRQGGWPKGMYSALAGFMEPGEAIEEACARELFEESGLRAVKVRYHSSQPWPYPTNLMIGLLAEVEDDEGCPDQTELEEVRWFTRDEARALLDGRLADVNTPSPMAIAHQLIKAWVEEG
jgi:NAD+ diphosphatase